MLRRTLVLRLLSASLLAAFATGCPFSSFEVVKSSNFPAAGAGGGGSGGMSPGTGGNNAGQGSVPAKAAPPQPRADSYFLIQGATLDLRAPGVLANDSPDELEVDDYEALTDTPDFAMTAELERSGRFVFAPDPRFFGVYELVYEVENRDGESADGKITVHVRPAEVDLSLLGDGFGGALLDGGLGDRLGSAIHAAGDVNGDGSDDLLIGAPGANTRAGAAFVVFGGSDPGDRDLNANPGSDQAAYYAVLSGETRDEGLGSSVSTLRDADGRTTALLLGATGGAGRIDRLDLATSLEDASPSFSVVRRSAIHGDLRESGVGRLVAAAGDVNADGFPDILAASQVGERGQLRVVYGEAEPSAELALADAPGLVLPASDDGDGFPLAFASAGDLDGDGDSEVLAASSSNILLLLGGGEYPESESAVSIDGSAYGFRALRAAPGSIASVSAIQDLDGDKRPELGYCDEVGGCRVVRAPVSTLTSGFRVTGFSPQSTVVSLVAAGDLDDDGVPDFAFAEDRFVHVVYGRRAAQADVDLTGLSGSGAGYRISMPAGQTISAVSAAGDWNKDGIADLAIADAAVNRRSGGVYVVFGVRSR
jgi:hypothetical protein